MARSRNIKPGLFKNEFLGEADPLITVLFMGLWCLADRDGKLEDRPKRIRAEIFPYREAPDVNGYLTVLEQLGFITRYTVDSLGVIKIINFAKHQSPHKTEKGSELPDAPDNPIDSIACKSTVKAPLNNGGVTEEAALIPDSFNLIPDSLNTDSLIPDSQPQSKELAAIAAQDVEDLFDKFYSYYPKKSGRQEALKAFKKLKLNAKQVDHLIADCLERVKQGAWCTGKGKAFIPGPAVYLNQKKWQDEIIPRPEFKKPVDYSQMAREAGELMP